MVVDVVAILNPDSGLLDVETNFNYMTESEKANIIELVEILGDTAISRLMIPLLETMEERELLKAGKSHFSFRPVTGTEAVDFFRRSSAPWIRSIANFTAAQLGKAKAS
jgi:hypothetical protein